MPLLSYDIERDVNNDELYIAQHHLLYPDRLQVSHGGGAVLYELNHK